MLGKPLSSPALEANIRYTAFISYSHADASVARWLHRALEAYRPPKEIVGRVTPCGPIPARLGRLFRDKEELAGAPELGPTLEAALRDSKAVIVVCSPGSARSVWVDKEIRYFRANFPERPVLAIIPDGVSSDDTDECFPPALRYGVSADGQLDPATRHEPLAADVGEDGRTTAKLKLAAALLGLAYGDLAQREQKRVRRQFYLGFSLVAAIIAVLSTTTITALVALEEARAQRAQARHEAAVAKLAQKKAEEQTFLATASGAALRDGVALATCPPGVDR